MPISKLFAVAILLSAATGLTGCSLYVNIPAQPGDVARNDPNLKQVGLAEEAALRYLLTERPIQQPVLILLPEGTSPATYETMMPKIGEFATWRLEGETEVGPLLPTLSVERVLIRYPQAEIDVRRPAFAAEPLGPTELVTVFLKKDLFAGWYVQRVRLWRLDQDPTPKPVYEPVTP